MDEKGFFSTLIITTKAIVIHLGIYLNTDRHIPQILTLSKQVRGFYKPGCAWSSRVALIVPPAKPADTLYVICHEMAINSRKDI